MLPYICGRLHSMLDRKGDYYCIQYNFPYVKARVNNMASDRVTKAALAAEKEFSKFLDELNQYEFMKVYDNEDQVPDNHNATRTVVQQALGVYSLGGEDQSDGTSHSEAGCVVSRQTNLENSIS
ncbi:hypothetical protein DPMN_052166 [Dreissena polymorpha]|uniref:Uncharacterized protein n=1 Tax=Dreissena polymorpha TaxID=45954 RepID=A0A9D4CLF0_DREPO|nr:hypothetical protein DPMN_052166 [Dreissena polymorpha]